VTSLAWSTLALLVVLLPGFSFLIGLYAPERFARDVTPRNPLSALAATVLVSLIAHTFLSLLVAWLGAPWKVDWPAVLDAVQMAPRAVGDKESAFDRAGVRFQEQGWAISGYVIASCLLGYWVGRGVGWLVVRGWFHGIAVQHAWVYPLQPGVGGVMTYAHVLTDIEHDGKMLLYRGRLKHFALAANGTFDYVVLAATGQRFLRLSDDLPTLGDTREIGDSRVPAAAEARSAEPWKAWARRWLRHPRESWAQRAERRSDEAFRRTAAARSADKALMMIPGSTIRDVVFQGLYQIPLGDATRRRARQLREKLALAGNDEDAELKALRAFRGGRESVAAAAMPTLELQDALKEIGIDAGPADGVAGSRTHRAVRQFQDQHGLHPDGVAGPITSARIRAERARYRARE
jgi:hypothetical protein